MKLEVKKLRPDALLPKYQTLLSAGMDLHALIEDDWEVLPGKQKIVPTGIAVSIPHGWEIQVRPRSGLAAKYGITITNSPGTIDCVVAGTLVATPAGGIPVEDLYTMDCKAPIYSYNEDSEAIEDDAISDMWIVDDLPLIEISTEDGKLIVVPENKEVLTKNGWKKAINLSTDDEILSL